MTFARIGRIIWAIGGLALVLGFGRETLLGLMPKPRELPRFDGATGKPWIDHGFVEPRIHQQRIETGALPAAVHVASSWVGGDRWQGSAETAWFKASRRTIHVAVAGYPQHRGCKLWAEFRTERGNSVRVECTLANPREQWADWAIRRPDDAIAVRICAEDLSADYAGWLAFSHPFRAWPVAITAGYQALQILATTALVLTLVWGPGLLCLRRTSEREWQTALLIGAGPIALAGAGLVLWLLGGWIRPQVLGLWLVSAAWVAIGIQVLRRDIAEGLSAHLRRTFGLTALIVIAVVAKSSYSVGPAGELFRGTVSRNFELADRIDSRYSFYLVQAVAHHWSPTDPLVEKLFSPWTIFSRGPLAGLASSPVVMATNAQPPTGVPESRWQPYDPSGFTAYRITMIGLASTVIVAFFLVLVPLLGERWSLIATGLLALSPFGVHEVLFTWPKWAATAWLLVSFGLAHARQPASAGWTLGVGFLFHPLVLLWTPWLALWIVGRGERGVKPVLQRVAKFGFGAGLIVLPWMTLGAWAPHLKTTPLPGQVGFLGYWKKADWKPATWESWQRTRWMNFANTFVPLHVYLSETSHHHPKLSSAYETSGKLERFSQVWWVSLPFALGLGLWSLSLVALAQAWRSHRGAVVLFVIAPSLFVTAYWGMDPLGLMRECGHPLAVAMIALTCLIAARQEGWLHRVLKHRAVPWIQLPETWLMLWLTTLLNPAPWAVDFPQLDVVYLCINGLALAAMAWLMARPEPTARPSAPNLTSSPRLSAA